MVRPLETRPNGARYRSSQNELYKVIQAAIAPEGSKDAPRWRRASQGCGSNHSKHPGQVPGPSAADGSLAHAYPARCTKTGRPDP